MGCIVAIAGIAQKLSAFLKGRDLDLKIGRRKVNTNVLQTMSGTL